MGERVRWVQFCAKDKTYLTSDWGGELWVKDRHRPMVRTWPTLEAARRYRDQELGDPRDYRIHRLTRGGKKAGVACQAALRREIDVATAAADRTEHELSSGYFGGWKARAEHSETKLAGVLLADLLRGMWAAQRPLPEPWAGYDYDRRPGPFGENRCRAYASSMGICSLPAAHPGDVHLDHATGGAWSTDGRPVPDPRRGKDAGHRDVKPENVGGSLPTGGSANPSPAGSPQAGALPWARQEATAFYRPRAWACRCGSWIVMAEGESPKKSLPGVMYCSACGKHNGLVATDVECCPLPFSKESAKAALLAYARPDGPSASELVKAIDSGAFPGKDWRAR